MRTAAGTPIALLAAVLAGAATPLRAAEMQADVALVLVTDVSRSIDDSEFQLEKRGYATAFTNPKVLAAIQGGPAGRIEVAYVEFAGVDQVQTLLGFTPLSDAASAKAFAERLLALPRSAYGRTSISSGVDQAARLLATAPADTRKVIDVAGDGTNNAGRPAAQARDDAVAAGITINGLAIVNDHPVSTIFAHVQPPGGLVAWYRENVTGGPGSFVVEVHDFDSFGEAMARKLLNEIAMLPLHSG